MSGTILSHEIEKCLADSPGLLGFWQIRHIGSAGPYVTTRKSWCGRDGGCFFQPFLESPHLIPKSFDGLVGGLVEEGQECTAVHPVGNTILPKRAPRIRWRRRASYLIRRELATLQHIEGYV